MAGVWPSEEGHSTLKKFSETQELQLSAGDRAGRGSQRGRGLGCEGRQCNGKGEPQREASEGWVERGSGCMIDRTGRADPRPWAWNGVGGGLNALVGALWVWHGGGGRCSKMGKGAMMCAEHWVWLVVQDVEAKTMRLEEHGKVVLVLERASQGAGPSRPPTPGRNR